MSKAIRQFLNNTDEGQEQVTTIRPSATALFAIDSDDRYSSYSARRANPTYPFTFAIQKNEALLNGFFKRMALTEFRMNWTLPNISKAWGNNTMVFYSSISNASPPTATTITVPDGFYSTELIANQLQTLISAVSGMTGFTVTVVVTDNDDFMIFTAPANVKFLLGPVLASANTRQLVDMINVPYPWTSSTLPISIAGVTNQMANGVTTGIPDMRATSYIDITSPQLTYNMDLKDTSSASLVRDMIARIYLDESVGSRSQVNINYYNNAPGSGAFATAFTAVAGSTGAGTGNIAVFTMTPSSVAFVGQTVYIQTATANTLNGSATIVAITGTTSITLEYPYALGAIVTTTGTMRSFNPQDMVAVSQGSWDDNVNGVSPFVLYRQFPYPKQIRWNKDMPIGNITFEMFDDQGRSLQVLWQGAYPTSDLSISEGRRYANSFSWNASILVSED